MADHTRDEQGERRWQDRHQRLAPAGDAPRRSAPQYTDVWRRERASSETTRFTGEVAYPSVYGSPTEGRRVDQAGEAVRERDRAGRRWCRPARTAADVMSSRPRAVQGRYTLRRVAEIMAAEDCGVVPVVDGVTGAVLGVVTDRDIVTRALSHDRDPAHVHASDVMSADVVTVAEDAPLSRVLQLMTDHRVRRLPVVDARGKLVGVVSIADLARAADCNEDLQRIFLDVAASRGFWTGMK